MESLRDRVVAVLSLGIDNLTAMERIHRTYDAAAVAIIASANANVVALRDRYANDAATPLDSRTVQELFHLSSFLKKIGEDSGNDRARQALEHEATLISSFCVSSGIVFGSDGMQFE